MRPNGTYPYRGPRREMRPSYWFCKRNTHPGIGYMTDRIMAMKRFPLINESSSYSRFQIRMNTP